MRNSQWPLAMVTQQPWLFHEAGLLKPGVLWSNNSDVELPLAGLPTSLFSLSLSFSLSSATDSSNHSAYAKGAKKGGYTRGLEASVLVKW